MTVAEALNELERLATEETRVGLSRFGIPNDNALGVRFADIRRVAKRIGVDLPLARDLWRNGVYEARILAAFVADPAAIESRTMDTWTRDFDNWAICDATCLHLFDRTPHAWKKVHMWAADRRGYVRRAGFATLWGLVVHDKKASDQPFVEALGMIEAMPADDRPAVVKAADMALRAIGKRNQALHRKAVATAKKLARAEHRSTAWIGRHAQRELLSEKVRSRLG